MEHGMQLFHSCTRYRFFKSTFLESQNAELSKSPGVGSTERVNPIPS